MKKEEYINNLIYLNNERIKAVTSKECFWGKKIIKYLSYLKRFKIVTLLKNLVHDIYAFFRKKNDNHIIINFTENSIKKIEKKIIVYTSIFGNYDKILEPLAIDDNCEYYIFTDQDVPDNSIWKKADCSLIPKECNTPALKNRYVKMFPHKLFKCDYSIYLDGNLQIVCCSSLLVQNSINSCKTGIAMHLAPRENCVYEEAKTVCLVGKITKKEKHDILKLYKENNMPKHFGMFECNVIVRNHNNKNMMLIMEKWWEYYKSGVKRDQLYFTYVIFKMGFKYTDIVNFGASVNKNFYFIRKEHK